MDDLKSVLLSLASSDPIDSYLTPVQTCKFLIKLRAVDLVYWESYDMKKIDDLAGRLACETPGRN